MQATLTRVLGSRAVNETKVGYNYYHWLRFTQTPFSAVPFLTRLVPSYESQWGPLMAPRPLTVNYIVNFSGLANGGSGQPQTFSQEDHSLRDDFTISANARGRHDVKIGGEVFSTHHWGYVCQNCVGTLDAQGGPLRPTSRKSSRTSTTSRRGISISFRTRSSAASSRPSATPTRTCRAGTPRCGCRTTGRLNTRLTLNLGARYDRTETLRQRHRHRTVVGAGAAGSSKNIVPRLGFVYSLTPPRSIRGGWASSTARRR